MAALSGLVRGRGGGRTGRGNGAVWSGLSLVGAGPGGAVRWGGVGKAGRRWKTREMGLVRKFSN